jgi:hypothetical protein
VVQPIGPCTVGYNEFDFFFFIKNFDFWRGFFARLASKFEKSTNMTLILFKIWKGIKNAKLHAYFKSVEKKFFKFTKKSFEQKKFDKHE